MAQTPGEAKPVSFARLMSTTIAARLLLDSSVQMFNPFLPIFAEGLGTSVVVMGRLVSLRSAMGLAAPAFGALADRTSYRRVMRGGLLATALGLLLVGSSPNLWLVAAGMVVMGLGNAAFVPTLHAYLSARLPYARRARGIGMLEYSWALTGIVGLSLMGLLIAATSWRAPFFVLAVGMVVMAWVFGTLPSARSGPPGPRMVHQAARASRASRAIGFFRLGDNAASAYSLLAASALTYFAAVQFMIVYGAWFASEYGLGARQLGTVALLFGLFDLTASVSVSLFTDRYGKRRSVLLGSSGALLGYLMIPWLNVGLIPAVLSTAFARGCFEFAIVSTIPLTSEQVPRQRGKVMTLSSAGALGASTLAAFVSPALYEQTGIGGVAALSAICAGGALVLVALRVREANADESTLDH